MKGELFFFLREEFLTDYDLSYLFSLPIYYSGTDKPGLSHGKDLEGI